jgi:hypothetical protein
MAENIGSAPNQPERPQPRTMQGFKLQQVCVYAVCAFQVQDNGKRPGTCDGNDFVGARCDADPAVGARLQLLQSSKLLSNRAAGVAGSSGSASRTS